MPGDAAAPLVEQSSAAISESHDRLPAAALPPQRRRPLLAHDLRRLRRQGARHGRGPKWASRNAKLRTSRKLLFAGGLVPVLLCHLCEPAATAAFLSRWFDASPLDRVGTAFLFVGLPDSGVRALAAYDRWIGLMSQPDIRAELDALTVEARDLSPAVRRDPRHRPRVRRRPRRPAVLVRPRPLDATYAIF